MKKSLSVLFCLVLMMISSGCSYQLPRIVATDCTAAHGGNPYACWKSLNLNNPRPAKGMSYHSAGTMSLAHATCVLPESQWWFHGAHIEYTQTINDDGNEELLTAYRMRYPRVAEYLQSKGSLQTTRWTKLTGKDLNKLGVPLCGATS